MKSKIANVNPTISIAALNVNESNNSIKVRGCQSG